MKKHTIGIERDDQFFVAQCVKDWLSNNSFILLCHPERSEGSLFTDRFFVAVLLRMTI